jgi:hypothetical protein
VQSSVAAQRSTGAQSQLGRSVPPQQSSVKTSQPGVLRQVSGSSSRQRSTGTQIGAPHGSTEKSITGSVPGGHAGKSTAARSVHPAGTQTPVSPVPVPSSMQAPFTQRAFGGHSASSPHCAGTGTSGSGSWPSGGGAGRAFPTGVQISPAAQSASTVQVPLPSTQRP